MSESDTNNQERPTLPAGGLVMFGEPETRKVITTGDASHPADRRREDRTVERIEHVEQLHAAHLKELANLQAEIVAIQQALKDSAVERAMVDSAGGPPQGQGLFDGLIQHEAYQAELGKHVDQRRLRNVRSFAAAPASTIAMMFPHLICHDIDTSAVAMRRMYRSGVVDHELDFLHGILSLVPTVPCEEAIYAVDKADANLEYGRAASAVATAAIDGDPTPKSTFVAASTQGVLPGTYVRVQDDAAAWHRLKVVSVDKSTNTVTVTTNSITFDAAIGNAVLYEYVSPVAEGSTKLTGSLGDSLTDYTLYTIPVAFAVTKQALWSKVMLRNWLVNKLPERIKASLAASLLYGPGTSGYLTGFLTDTSRQTKSWSAMAKTTDTQVDLIQFAIHTMITGDITNAAVCLSKADFDAISRLKDTLGRPLYKVDKTPGSRSIEGIRVEIDEALIAGDAVVLVPGAASELALNPNTEGLTVGYVNAQLLENKITMLYEIHGAHAMLSPYKAVDLYFDAAPT